MHLATLFNRRMDRSLKTIATGLSALALAISFAAPAAQAQSAIEKLAVPKSKLVSSFWKKNDASSKIKIDHGPWDAFLGKYVRTDGRGVNVVAYRRVSSADKAALKTYLTDLQSVDVPSLNRNEQYAYWLNLYNAATVSIVLDNYPVESIRDIKRGAFDFIGPFNDKVVKVNGKSLTLNDIESGIVRPIWNDPLLHYAFNCAAISCPNLGKKAYRGGKIRGQLASAASRFVNDPRGISVKDGKVTASKIYFWYQDDFGGSEASVLKHIKQFAAPELKGKLANIKSIDDYEYDWSLNEAG
ncbi:MAG: DUF547 domain-containing protein [Pseudomonadota bacterium]